MCHRGGESRDGYRVARKPIVDMEAYKQHCARAAIRSRAAGARVRTAQALAQARRVRRGRGRTVIRAAVSFVEQGLGTALLVGREDRVRKTHPTRFRA